MPQPESGKYMLDPSVKNCYKDWLPHRGCDYKVIPEPVVVEIKIYNPPADTVFTIPNDFSNPYDNEPPYLILPDDE